MQNLRIIPNLEIKENYVVKGFQYEGVKKIGDPEKIAETLYKNGADELIFIDTVASLYQRNNLIEVIRNSSKKIFIPLTVGGGIKNLKDIYNLLRAGADKVAINTYATKNRNFITKAAKEFGSQCIVLFVQAKLINNEYFCLTDNSRENSGLKVTNWIQAAEELGAGEILLSSVDKDGAKNGYDYNLINDVLKISNLPIIPHGGCGKNSDIYNLIIKNKKLNAVSLSSHLYSNKLDVKKIKNFLNKKRIKIRK